jgi:hypothetical protein
MPESESEQTPSLFVDWNILFGYISHPVRLRRLGRTASDLFCVPEFWALLSGKHLIFKCSKTECSNTVLVNLRLEPYGVIVIASIRKA